MEKSGTNDNAHIYEIQQIFQLRYFNQTQILTTLARFSFKSL